MSMTMEQAVTQLQQEVFPLRAQVAAESGLADAVRAINNLATAQVRKDTPSLIDVKGLGRRKEFTGREEDFPPSRPHPSSPHAAVPDPSGPHPSPPPPFERRPSGPPLFLGLGPYVPFLKKVAHFLCIFNCFYLFF